MSWTLIYTKRAVKDARKLAASNLKEKAQTLLNVIVENPYQTPPAYEKIDWRSLRSLFETDQY